MTIKQCVEQAYFQSRKHYVFTFETNLLTNIQEQVGRTFTERQKHEICHRIWDVQRKTGAKGLEFIELVSKITIKYLREIEHQSK